MVQFEQVFDITCDYLHFPIRNGAKGILMQLVCEGKVQREFTVELAIDGPRQWWAHYDVRAFRGRTIILRTKEAPLTNSQHDLLQELIHHSDGLLAAQDLYQEKYRPQLHFTPRRGWNNDPNGLVYYHDTWHLFYQHNPFGIEWGNMHWGHATSTDLTHWEEKPIALFPQSIEDAAFSGGAVIDISNTSEFGIAAEEPMVLSYTSTGRGECLAYSLDMGQTFQEYIDNPVHIHQGRDPKIIRLDAESKWVMVVYEEGNGNQGYDILESRDLMDWHWLQHLPDWFECPELFELPLMGDQVEDKLWVVYGCVKDRLRSAYQLGVFDGNQFSPISDKMQAHAGPHFYAAQIFSNSPDNRIIMVGWLAGAQYPEMPFGHGMSLPLALSLRKIDEEVRLCFYPVEEFNALRTSVESHREISIQRANELLAGIKFELIDIEIEFDLSLTTQLMVDIGTYILKYNSDGKELSFAGSNTKAQPGSENLHLRIIIDRSVTEIFIDRGWGAFSAMTIFEQNPPKIFVDGTASISTLKIFELQSIW